MTETTVDYSHLGVGQFYFRRRGQQTPYRPLGNAEQIQFAIDQNTIEQAEYRRPGGGMRNQIERIAGVTLSMTVFDLSPTNIASVIYGEQSQTESGTAKEETLTVYIGGLIPLSFPDPTNVTVSEWDGDTAGPELTEGTDYQVTDGGLWIPEDSSVSDGTEVQVTYDHGTINTIEALMNSGHEFEGSFRGFNEARSKPFSVDIHRFRFQPTEELGLVGSEFTTLSMQARVLSDASKGSGQSSFFRMLMAD